MQDMNKQQIEEQIKQMKQMQQAMQQQMQQAMTLNLSAMQQQQQNTDTNNTTNNNNQNTNDNNQNQTATTPLVSQLLQLNNTSIFQNAVNQPSPTIPTPTHMTSKYSFPTPNQMNPMLPSVLTPVHTATTPKTTNPFDSAMVANGLNFTVQQIVAAQKANASTPKGATSRSPLNQLNPSSNSLTNFNGSSASLDISHSGSLGNLQMGSLAALRSSSADNLLNAINNPGTPRNTVSTPKNNTPNNNTPHTPTLATAPSLPALQPTTSVGSLLSFRGLSDPLSNLASGLPRMDSSGLFLPTVHRENSIPQMPTTPNITRNISELSLLSQGNSHFVPYGGATGYFEPPTPSQNDGTQTPTITTPNLATNNNSSGPYAQFQYTMNIQQQQNKLKQINNNTITNVNKPVDNSNKPVVTDNKKDIINKSMNKQATDNKKDNNKKTGNKDNNQLTLMAEGKITVTSNIDPNKNPDGVIKNPKGLTLDLNTEQNDDIDEQVIITPNLMNLNSLTGGGGGPGGGTSLSPQINGFTNTPNYNMANMANNPQQMGRGGAYNNMYNQMMMNPMMGTATNPMMNNMNSGQQMNGMMSPGWGGHNAYGTHHQIHNQMGQHNTNMGYNNMQMMNQQYNQTNNMMNQWQMNNMNMNNNMNINNRNNNNNYNNQRNNQNDNTNNNKHMFFNNANNNYNGRNNNNNANNNNNNYNNNYNNNNNNYGNNNYNNRNNNYNNNNTDNKNIPPRQQQRNNTYNKRGGGTDSSNSTSIGGGGGGIGTGSTGGGSTTGSGGGGGGGSTDASDISSMDPRQLTRSNISLSQLIEARVIEKLARDQNGSRFIQQRLETASLSDKEGVFRQIERNALALCEDVFGNYVIQKFFEHGTDTHRIALSQIIRGRVLPLTKSMYGCRVIQKAFEYVHDHLKITLVSELRDHVEDCVRDQNGNHVIQKVIAEVPSLHIAFIIDTFKGKVYHFSTHPYGCRVIQRLLEHCDETQKEPLLNELIGSILALSKDSYGNYVVQHVLKHGPDQARNRIIREVANNVLAMSKHKFSSNVVEKCFMFGNDDERDHLLECVIGTTQENSPMVQMVRDQYGNYVIQKLLEVTNVAQRNRLIKNVMQLVPNLRKLMFGKHIIAKIEKITGKTVQ